MDNIERRKINQMIFFITGDTIFLGYNLRKARLNQQLRAHKIRQLEILIFGAKGLKR